ncbi:MAG TPA: ExsB family transcriptional regulator [Methanothermococcus okinawensis]|uniref:ExsB family transcriptional regulator n=1 Tax=Methanothermococcus okinawensis TaxID=155863 RepID=A0A832ZE19_9EURY|nr:ExsB family transcriptional regulator [Methanothermococcus okinawensis]HIP90703.1 ExsB family transcriptional regulator [Methanothermococcus okinawensis]
MYPELRDLLLRASMKNLESLYSAGVLEFSIYNRLKVLLSLSRNFNRLLDYIRSGEEGERERAVVALSGGVDSTASALISKRIFRVVGVTVYSPYIMEERDRSNISQLVEKLGITCKFIEVDLEDIKLGTLEGRFHPCGRCHKRIEESVLNYAREEGIKYVVYGDMLSTGNLSIVEEGDIVRINMPSFLSLTKNHSREILKTAGIEIKQRYTCPLLKIAHRYERNKRFTIQRILREVRAQVIDREEGLRNILEVLNQH